MKINVAKTAGFCFGVKRAIDMAFKTVSSQEKVYMLGDIVHNEQVAKEIEKAGIKKVKRLTKDRNKTFLLGAHGTSQDIINKAKRLGYKIADATCPMVKEIHSIVKKMSAKGYCIIVIGDKNHDEVRGIIGQIKGKAIVIDGPADISYRKIKKAAVVVQSTQNIEKVLRIVEALKPHIEELKFFNTVCQPTRMKQEEIRKMPKENDIMIIIGSKASANTKRLYEISKSINPRSFWVQSKKDIKRAWFKGAKSTGITAGASTPNTTIHQIAEYIKGLN